MFIVVRPEKLFVHFCWLALACAMARGQERTTPDVVIKAGEEELEHDQFTEPGEYGQPAWAERSRMSSTTSVYVLSPYEIFVGNVWEADFTRHGKSVHDLTQEIDLGLLHRFEVGFQNDLGLIGSDAHETSGTIEARYALANWNAVTLNPAISVEYVFGFGKSVKSTNNSRHHGVPTLHDQPDAVAARLLLGQNFGSRIGYGFNLSLQQDVTRDSGRHLELSQSLAYGVWKGKLELGAEMRYAHRSRGHEDELVIGPALGWKPTRQIRIGLSPLVGCTHDSPHVATFLLVSYEFGGAEAIVSPISQTDR